LLHGDIFATLSAGICLISIKPATHESLKSRVFDAGQSMPLSADNTCVMGTDKFEVCQTSGAGPKKITADAVQRHRETNLDVRYFFYQASDKHQHTVDHRDCITHPVQSATLTPPSRPQWPASVAYSHGCVGKDGEVALHGTTWEAEGFIDTK